MNTFTIHFTLEELRILHAMLNVTFAETERELARCSHMVKISDEDMSKSFTLKPEFLHRKSEVSDKITKLNWEYYMDRHLGLTKDRNILETIHKKIEGAFDDVYEMLEADK